jgi:hypothetical protein
MVNNTYFGVWLNFQRWFKNWADDRFQLKTEGLPTNNAFDLDTYNDLMPALSLIVDDPYWELDGSNNLMPKAA